MPSIGHPDGSICAHFTAKHGNIVELGLLSITGSSCEPRCERPLPNLVTKNDNGPSPVYFRHFLFNFGS
jgi:hypothetical protein